MHIFFLISSVGFVVLFGLVAVLLYYSIRATRTFSDILEKVDRGVDHISDTTKEVIGDLRDSMIFNFLFRKRKRSRKD